KGFIMATNIFGITTYWMSIKLYYNEEDLLSDKKNQIKKLVSELQRERDFIQFNVSALGMKNLIAFKLYQPELVSIFEIENDAKGHT
ncbi:MAG: hypothetical protein MRY83_22965, partial [Flavobacteriales bacterium]|nr:hypothetical protein [Flavobacteriales bacterium]